MIVFTYYSLLNNKNHVSMFPQCIYIQMEREQDVITNFPCFILLCNILQTDVTSFRPVFICKLNSSSASNFYIYIYIYKFEIGELE